MSEIFKYEEDYDKKLPKNIYETYFSELFSWEDYDLSTEPFIVKNIFIKRLLTH